MSRKRMGSSTPLRHGCEDNWTWNRDDRSPEVRLYGPSWRVARFHPTWSSGTAAVRGTRVLNNGRYYWELRLSQRIFGTSMMFGVGTRRARLHVEAFLNLLGEDEHSWGLSHKGLLWHAGRWTQYTKPFRENRATTVGVLFDGVAGTLSFYKDGANLGVAFRGLHRVREPLYPIVCSTAARTEMTLVHMKRDFVNLQDRCRAVILARVRSDWLLEDLELPARLRRFLREGLEDSPLPPPQSPVQPPPAATPEAAAAAGAAGAAPSVQPFQNGTGLRMRMTPFLAENSWGPDDPECHIYTDSD